MAAPIRAPPASAAEVQSLQDDMEARASEAKQESKGALEKGHAQQAIEAGERAVALDETGRRGHG